jgi:hypothetical protein
VSAVIVTFQGIENLNKIFKEFPEMGYRKPIMAGFRKASAPVKKAMKSNLPANLRGAARSIKAVAYKTKEPEMGVGIFSKGITYQNRRGKRWSPWQLIYWHNYGTMAGRSAEHSFITPRRKKTAGSSGGIKAGMFIEKAWDQSSAQAQKNFEETVEKETIKFFEKYAAK